MGNEMSAWWKVFLRNGLIWTPYVLAWPLLTGEFSGPGWPLGYSETMKKVGTFVILLPTWFMMVGGTFCLFRVVLREMIRDARRMGFGDRRLTGPRWFLSYFLEIDEENRLRP